MSSLRRLLPSPHALFVFEAAARHLNFRRAADELNVTQPSVSHTIKALEAHGGARLFVRENRGVRLTDAGRELYEAVRTGFDRIEGSLKRIGASGTHYLTFAASTTLAAHWLMPQLYQLQQDHPALKIRILTTDRDIEPEGEIDMTIWIRPRELKRERSWYLCDEVVFPVCSPAWLAAHGPLDGMADLHRVRLLHATDRHRRRLTWNEWLTAAGAEPLAAAPAMIFDDFLLAIQAALAGEGVALGWNLSFDLLLRNRLLVRPLPNEVRTGNAFFLLAAEGAERSEAMETLVAWFLERTAGLRGEPEQR